MQDDRIGCSVKWVNRCHERLLYDSFMGARSPGPNDFIMVTNSLVDVSFRTSKSDDSIVFKRTRLTRKGVLVVLQDECN